MAYYSINLNGMDNLIENGKTRNRITKFVIKDSGGLSLTESNNRAIDEGKVMSESHFFVQKNGIVYTVRPEKYFTEYTDDIFNKYTMVIEVEGEFTWENISQKQYNAILELTRYLGNKYRTFERVDSLVDEIGEGTLGPGFPLDDINLNIESNYRYGLEDDYVVTLRNPIKNNIELTTPFYTGNDVLVLKHKLIKIGVTKIELNDTYDTEVAKIVNSLKYINGLKLDYTCTAEVVDIIDKMIQDSVNEANFINKPYFKRLLYLANPPLEGADVTLIQERLYLLDMYYDRIDGRYTKSVASAVVELQKKLNLTVDGMVDLNIWKYLMGTSSQEYNRLLYYREDQPLEGSDILALQNKLNELGYTVNVTGVYDEVTQKIITDYQTNNRLDITGAVNSVLYERIMGE